jgi:hypothetical protein
MSETHDRGVSSAHGEPLEKGSSYAALVLPIGWGFIWVSVMADLAPNQTFTAVWFGFGTLSCLAAVVVIVAGGKAPRREWAWAIGAIPASFLGPLAAALLLVPTIRHDLVTARLRPMARKRDRYEGPVASRLRLVGSLAGCIAAAAAIFIGLITLGALGGMDSYSNHDLQVILLISVLPAAGAVLVVSWQWTQKGPDRLQRAAIALPMALLAQAILWATIAWAWSQRSN